MSGDPYAVTLGSKTPRSWWMLCELLGGLALLAALARWPFVAAVLGFASGVACGLTVFVKVYGEPAP